MPDEAQGENREAMARQRREYRLQSLDVSDIDSDPVDQFRAWLNEALAADLREPNAMSLATATPGGAPSLRIVLLKDFGPEGFTFFTNYASRKGAELAANPRASLLFFWAELERQVRIEGEVKQTSRAESEAYFHSRPRRSQLGALASHQSAVLPDRAAMEAEFARLEETYRDHEVPLPDTWGGYRLLPDSFEFWQGRENRMHDRMAYRRKPEAGAKAWIIERLAP